MSSKATVVLAGLRSVFRQATLNARCFDKAVAIGEALGRLNGDNNDGLLSEEPLEAALYDQYGDELAARAPVALTPPVEWLHVISTAYRVGGHTRLLALLVRAQQRAGRSAAVAITRARPEVLREVLDHPDVPVHEVSGNHARRVAALVSLGRQAQNIVLHIHPDDLAVALAARRLASEGRCVLFVNHADHVFSYGPGAANACLEVSGFGWRLTAARRAVRAQHFLGIPVTETAEPAAFRAVSGRPRGPVLSMGSAGKYHPAGGYDFPAFVSELMDRTDAEMEIVGPTAKDGCWASVLARHGHRLRLLGTLPFPEASARLAAAIAYVDSFPMTGGTAFPQALLSGKSVFGPSAHTGGYSLADALRYPSVSEMTDALVMFLATGQPPGGEDRIRSRIGMEFNADAVAERLAEAARSQFLAPPAELLSVPCGLDHHVDIWRAQGRVKFRLRPLRRKPPLGLVGRVQLLRWVLKGI
jgi:hypothetical protein